MKKVSIITVAVMLIAGYASADIAVGFTSAPPVLDGAPIANGFVAQLIWSSAPRTGAGGGLLSLALTDNDGDFVANANEYVLVEETGMSPGIFDATVSQNGGFAFQFDDVDVGGQDINSGWLYSRIVATTVGNAPMTINAGDWYLETSLVQLGAGLGVYTNPDGTKNTPINSTTILLAPTPVQADGLQVVVPEPATISLMGIAGLGMFLARRKARR